MKPVVTYSQCTGDKCQSISLEGDKNIIPFLAGFAVCLLMVKAIN